MRLPIAPASLEHTGLSPAFLQELLLKSLHYSESPAAAHLAQGSGLPTAQVIQVLDILRRDNLIEIIGSTDYTTARDYRYRLTDKGEVRSERALDRCRYAGPAPVTLSQYESVIASLGLRESRPSKASVQEAFQSLVLDEPVVDRLTSALRSARPAMVFGSSGNGKSHMLTSFVEAMEGDVLVPYSIYAHGQIIRVFDPKVHEKVQNDHRHDDNTDAPDPVGLSRRQARLESEDRRWVRIKRPGIIVGGEIGQESLELGYDPVTRFYQAPLHLKAQGGVFVVDDFGRQKVTPAELLNRWIMALERERDQLLLRTGEVLDVPFHVTLLFSTNLNPDDLADPAYLRRIPYKVFIPDCRREQFTTILKRACDTWEVRYEDDTIEGVVSFIELVRHGSLNGSLCRDLVSILAETCRQANTEPMLTVNAIELAYQQFTGIADGQLLQTASTVWREEGAELDRYVA